MLRGKAVILREARDSDFRALSAIRNDIGLQLALMATPRPNSRARVAEWIKRRSSDPEGAFFVVADLDDSAPIGFIQLAHIDLLHRHAEMGICVQATNRGTGQSREALALVEDYAVENFNLRKIVLRVLSRNARAISFFGKCGYRQVGILRKHHYEKRLFQDVTIMEKLLKTTGNS